MIAQILGGADVLTPREAPGPGMWGEGAYPSPSYDYFQIRSGGGSRAPPSRRLGHQGRPDTKGKVARIFAPWRLSRE